MATGLLARSWQEFASNKLEIAPWGLLQETLLVLGTFDILVIGHGPQRLSGL